MPDTKVLISVTTYPLPSRSYDELVCTAGVLENGDWIRIYPVPLKFLRGLRKDGKVESFKYNWIELDLSKRTDDFRPESFSPVDYSFSNINVLGKIDTKHNWRERKDFCLKKVYTNKARLHFAMAISYLPYGEMQSWRETRTPFFIKNKLN